MTLTQVAQVLGAIGVIASMIYIGVQIRNNARSVRAATYQQLSGQFISHWLALAGNVELVDIALRGGDDFDSLTRIEKARMRFVLLGYIRQYQNAYFQHQIGTLKEDDWKSITGDMEAVLSLPGVQKVWTLIRGRSSPEFQVFVDGIVAEAAKAVAEGQANV